MGVTLLCYQVMYEHVCVIPSCMEKIITVTSIKLYIIMTYVNTSKHNISSSHMSEVSIYQVLLLVNLSNENYPISSIDGLVKDCSNPIVLAMELLQSCTKSIPY